MNLNLLRSFRRSFLGRVAQIHMILVIFWSIAAGITCKIDGLLGIWISFVWLLLNGFLIQLLMVIAIQGKPADKQKAFVICLIKFPVLYLGGFWLLINAWVSVEGILWGLTLYFAALLLEGGRVRFKGLLGNKT